MTGAINAKAMSARRGSLIDHDPESFYRTHACSKYVSTQRRLRREFRCERACVRSGRTLDQVAFLVRIPRSRLQALIAGEPMTIDERQALMRVLPDWKPW